MCLTQILTLYRRTVIESTINQNVIPMEKQCKYRRQGVNEVVAMTQTLSTITDRSIAITDKSITITDKSITITDKSITITDKSITDKVITEKSITVTIN